MDKDDRHNYRKGLLALGIIWLAGAVCDRIWFALDRSVPAWDQADYLTGSLNYWQALQHPQWFSGEWWASFWQLTSKVPPFTYIATAIVQNIFGIGADKATIVNLFFSAILLASVYGLGVELFSVEVGLLAAAICQVLPGLYRFRLDFLLDYPLASVVTLCFYCLTVWRNINTRTTGRRRRKEWLWAVAFGISLGVALMVKQTALFFLLIPIILVINNEVNNLFNNLSLKIKNQPSFIFKALERVAQLLGALLLSVLVFGPWYRTNWLLVLTSGKRASIDSAIAEGDPALNTLDAWIFYWKDLPYIVSWPLLIVPIVGLLIYLGKLTIKRVEQLRRGAAEEIEQMPAFQSEQLPKVISLTFGFMFYLNKLVINQAEKQKPIRTEGNAFPLSPIKWLAIFWVSAYLLCSININKDTRYVLPYLPVLSLFLAYCLTLWFGRWAQYIRRNTIALAILLMLANIYPIGGSWLTQIFSPRFQHYPDLATQFPHQQVIGEIIQTEPYLRSTLGVLPSTPKINQHNLNYYGALSNFQVYGRQVGTRKKFVQQDARSLSWFVTKTGDQGSIPSEAQAAIVQIVERGGNFQLHKTWTLPDGSNLNLYHSRTPPVIVKPLSKAGTQISLNRVIVPNRVPPGVPVPVIYDWSGSWKELRSGLVLLTWRKAGVADEQLTSEQRWLHDRAIGMGNLYVDKRAENRSLQVIERTAMLPPANIIPGTYTLEVTYLDRQTGESYFIPVPPIKLIIDPTAKATPAPELDLVTQFRNLAAGLPLGPKGLEPVFDQTGRINQYDPTQDYLLQAGQSLNYRLQQEPQNLQWSYAFALTKVLRRNVDGAIAALERVTQLDSQNPYAYAYLAFVHLYGWHPQAAETALKPALALNPNLPELRILSGAAALMQGNFVKAWHYIQPFVVTK